MHKVTQTFFTFEPDLPFVGIDNIFTDIEPRFKSLIPSSYGVVDLVKPVKKIGYKLFTYSLSAVCNHDVDITCLFFYFQCQLPPLRSELDRKSVV